MKDKTEEKISKVVLDWLTNIVTFITILAGILSVFLPDTSSAEKYAWGVFIPLAIISAAFIYFRYSRVQKLKISDSLEPITSTSALRGLLPFEEGDQLPLRGRVVQDIYTLVTSSRFQFGVLWGESGCGKTSVLRAGLIPKLKEANYLPLYIPKPTKDPMEAIHTALIEVFPNNSKGSHKSLNDLLKAAISKGFRIIIIFDQFEEFFLTNRTVKSRTSFIKWLGEAISKNKMPVSVLIGIRSDFFAHLQNFAPQIPEPTSIHTSFQLHNFDSEQARQMLYMAANADGIPFESELIQAVVSELEVDEFVRPAELQVVGTRLKRKNIVTVNKYEIFGGARGILSSYIKDEITQSSNQQVAKLILRLMCAETNEAKSPTDLSMEAILRYVSGSAIEFKTNSKKEEVQKILDRFISARVLVRTEENKYNLAHDYLASYVRVATEGVETSVERANHLLKRYAAEYREDVKTRIPYRHLYQIWRFASANLKNEKRARDVIRKSKNTYFSIVAMPLVLISILYLFLLSSYYFSFDDEGFLVLKQGYPRLEFLPGFDQIVIQTEYSEDDLREGVRDEIIRGEHSGFWLARSGTMAEWGLHLARILNNNQEILRLVDSSVLVEILKTPNFDFTGEEYALSDNDINDRTSEILIELIQFNPEKITPEFVHELIVQMPNSHWKVPELLSTVAHVAPQYITKEDVRNITNLLSDSNADTREKAAYTLDEIVQAIPEHITQELVEELVHLFSDTDDGVRATAIRTIGSISETRPEYITPEIIDRLVTLLSKKGSYFVQNDAIETLTSIIQTSPERITPEVVRALMNMLPSNLPLDYSRSVYALNTIADVAPHYITPEIVQELIDLLADDNTYLANDAASVIYYVAQIAPERIPPDAVRNLFDFLSHSNINVQSISAETLGNIAEIAPELISIEIAQELKGLLSNNDEGIRQNATFVLSRLSERAPELITPDIIQELHTVLLDNNLYVRVNGIYVIYNLSQTAPEGITPEILQELIKILSETNLDERPIAVLVFASLAQTAPEHITPEVLQLLTKMLSDSDAEVRINSAQAIGNIAQITPEQITPEIMQKLITMLSEENNQINSSAMISLRKIIWESPDLISPDNVQKLIPLLSHSDENVRNNASETLNTIAQVKPELITSEVVLTLTDLLIFSNSNIRASTENLLNDMGKSGTILVAPEMLQKLRELILIGDDDVRANATEGLGSVLEVFPEYITHEILIDISGLLSDSNPSVRTNSIEVFGKIAEVAPEHITSEIVQILTNLLTDESNSVRLGAVETLSIIAQTAPDPITSEVVQKLQASLSDSDQDIRLQSVIFFRIVGQTIPEQITSEFVQKLINMASDKDPEIRLSVSLTLGEIAEARPNLITPEYLDQIFNLLKNDTSVDSRNGATYVLFEIARGNKDLNKVVRDRLLGIQESSQPHWRLNASRTLDMLSVYDLVDIAYSDSKQVKQIKTQLNTLSNLNEDHINYATQLALQEIEMIEDGNK